MKTTKVIATSLVACLCLSGHAQNPGQEDPKGNAIVKVFANLHSGFDSDIKDRGFELERSYLGYTCKLNDELSVKGVIDIGKSKDVSDYQRLAYIKNAQVTWKKGDFTLNGGLISTIQFNMQEKAWGYRYIMKSFQDNYKFGSSADLGLSVAYKPCDWFSADAIIVNGEGYKKIQVDDGFNYGLGMTFIPIEGLKLRLYGGINEGTASGEKNTANVASFIGYNGEHFSLGAEYNYMKNAGFTEDADKNGYSIYASGRISEKMDVYARFDDLYTDTKDEGTLLLGLQMKLNSYIKLAPNFRMDIAKNDGEDNYYSAFINCYFGL